ncbi:MAG: hypothetical protein WDM81_19045 [Rhizomicrobium sp.]
MRHAVCLFSDIAWRRHPDDRALGAFGQVLTAPFAGASHRTRAMIASGRVPPLFRRRGFPARHRQCRPARPRRREPRPRHRPDLPARLRAVGLFGGRAARFTASG